MVDLIKGSIYQDSSSARRTPAPKSELHDRLRVKFEHDLVSVFDSQQENALKALLATLDLHNPWQNWEQVFKPTYIGDRYLGVGCRSCNWLSPVPCPTIQAIAKAFNIHE